MKRQNWIKIFGAASITAWLVALGCMAHQMGKGGKASKGGGQLWEENCMRCHNSRSPSTLSDAQWEVAMQHMRVRANLTAEEYRAIRKFLKAGN